MDPVTHSLMGGLSAKTARVSRRRFWIMMFLGVAPDLDLAVNLFPSASVFWGHHGLTHSIMGVVIQVLLYAVILSRFDPGPFRTRALHYTFPMALHVFCDFVTGYGIPLLAPFTFRNYSADIVGSLVIAPTLIMIAGLIHAFQKKEEGWRATKGVWIFWGMYMLY